MFNWVQNMPLKNTITGFDDEKNDYLKTCYFGMLERQKTISLISNWDHYQRFSPSQIPDAPRAEFEPVENLSSSFVE